MKSIELQVVDLVSEQLAKEIVLRKGKDVSDSQIAIAVADLMDNLFCVDLEVFHEKVRTGVKNADVYVSVYNPDEEN